MAAPPMLSPMSEADYEAIETAVMETARGRWFLAEHARRNRLAETQHLHEALQRIEDKIDSPATDPHFERVRMSIMEMAQAIARTKDEIAAIKPTHDVDGRFGEATEELDAIVTTTETATGDILHAAEQIQEVAWTLRERGFEGPICDMLDERATDIYTACSFQDLTGQRTRKVIGVLRYLEARINAMIDIWGLEGAPAAPAQSAATAAANADAPLGRQLAHGPALPGMGLEQTTIDAMLGPDRSGVPDSGIDAAFTSASFASMSIDDIMSGDFAEPASTLSVADDDPDDAGDAGAETLAVPPVQNETQHDAEDDAEVDTDNTRIAQTETGHGEAKVSEAESDAETADAAVETIDIENIDIEGIDIEAFDIDAFDIDTIAVQGLAADIIAVDVTPRDEPAETAAGPAGDTVPHALDAPPITADFDDGPSSGNTGTEQAEACQDVTQQATQVEFSREDPAPSETAGIEAVLADKAALDTPHAETTPDDAASLAAPSLAPDQPAARLTTAEIDQLAPAERIALFT